MNSKYNVLYLCMGPLTGGAEISLLSLLENLDRELYNPVVLVPMFSLNHSRYSEDERTLPGLNEKLAESGVEVISFRCSKLKMHNPVPYILTILKLIHLIRKYNIDLIHSNEFLANQYGIVASRLCRIPMICHVRVFLTHKAVRNTFIAYTNALIANSQAVADSLVDFNIDPSKITVIHNGIDRKKYEFNTTGRTAFRRRWNIDSETILLGVIGRICDGKGQDTAIRALSLILEKHKNVRLIIAGDTAVDHSKDYLAYLKHSVLHSGIKDKVVFTGFIEDNIEIYSGIDILLVPSVNEPFGRVLIEAMACQRAVIASNAGGPKEIIVHRKNGLLFQGHDDIELATLTCELIDNRELRNSLGEEAAKDVRVKFDIQKHAERVETVYRRVLTNSDLYKKDINVGYRVAVRK